MNSLIESVYAHEILDSRGNPTVEVEVTLADGSMDGLQYPQVPQQVYTKHSSFVMATITLWRKGF